MSFFDLQRFRRDQDAIERAVRDKKLLEERIEHLKWQQRSDEYNREQQDSRAQEQLERERENQREEWANHYREVQGLRADLEDLKLRRKFGIEQEGE